MLDFIIPLISSWSPIFVEYIYPVFGLVVIAFVPALFYSFFRG